MYCGPNNTPHERNYINMTKLWSAYHLKGVFFGIEASTSCMKRVLIFVEILLYQSMVVF